MFFSLQYPTDVAEREAFLKNLVIFIEHNDGEKNLVKPKVVEYKDGLLGLQFDVNKFSTFTILNMEGWKEGDHKSYITGYVDGKFRPNANITRAEMATILARNLSFDESKIVASSYPDVSSIHWVKNAIEFVKEAGLMIGDNNGSFRPDAPITRGEMAAIAARYKKLATPSITNSKFQDVHRSHWAATSIEAVRKAGIVHGYQDGTYKPNGNLTRAEAVKIVNRLFDREPLYGVSSPSWPDVPTSHWAYTEIEEASQDHFYKSHFKI